MLLRESMSYTKWQNPTEPSPTTAGGRRIRIDGLNGCSCEHKTPFGERTAVLFKRQIVYKGQLHVVYCHFLY